MAAPYIEIVEVLAARLATVPNVGVVHPYQRYARDPEKFRELFIDTGNSRLSTWMISRESIGDNPLTNLENETGQLFVFRGYMAIDDAAATELIFQQVINDICEKFRPQDDLDGLVEWNDPVQARTIGYQPFGGVFCHAAELTIRVQELLSS